ncbi:hypothetical protein BDC45DRAFT_453360, partial [Circinella umbellata]
FCQVHRAEIAHKKEANEVGYPMEIDFKALPQRILSFKDSLLMIVKGTLNSSFLKAEIEFIKQNNVTKSRSTSGQYCRFDKASAGYYRNCGSAIILKVLQHEFIITKKITFEDTKPLMPLPFLQSVLVPEACVRLIQQDYNDIW